MRVERVERNEVHVVVAVALLRGYTMVEVIVISSDEEEERRPACKRRRNISAGETAAGPGAGAGGSRRGDADARAMADALLVERVMEMVACSRTDAETALAVADGDFACACAQIAADLDDASGGRPDAAFSQAAAIPRAWPPVPRFAARAVGGTFYHKITMLFKLPKEMEVVLPPGTGRTAPPAHVTGGQWIRYADAPAFTQQEKDMLDKAVAGAVRGARAFVIACPPAPRADSGRDDGTTPRVMQCGLVDPGGAVAAAREAASESLRLPWAGTDSRKEVCHVSYPLNQARLPGSVYGYHGTKETLAAAARVAGASSQWVKQNCLYGAWVLPVDVEVKGTLAPIAENAELHRRVYWGEAHDAPQPRRMGNAILAWSVAKVDKEITASNIGDGMNGIRADGSTGRAVCQALEEAMRERGVPPDGQLTP